MWLSHLLDVIMIGILSSIVALTGHVHVFALFLSRNKEHNLFNVKHAVIFISNRFVFSKSLLKITALSYIP